MVVGAMLTAETWAWGNSGRGERESREILIFNANTHCRSEGARSLAIEEERERRLTEMYS